MNCSFLVRAALVLFCLASAAQPARAAIVATGDVEPAGPSTWTSSTAGYIGNTASGTVTVNSGSDLYSGYSYVGYNNGVRGLMTISGTGSTWNNSGELDVGYQGNGTLTISGGGTVNSGDVNDGYGAYIGYWPGSSGVVTVGGTGTTWNNSYDLYVGNFGNAMLYISSGGSVTVGGASYVGFDAGSTGTINFSGGTLTTQSLYASPSQLSGTGTINTYGLVSDVNLVFDSTHGLRRTLSGFGSVTVNLDMSNPSNVGDLVRLSSQRFTDHSRWDYGQLPVGLDWLRLRLGGHGDGQRKRLDVEQQRMARGGLARQWDAEHLQQRGR